MSHEQYTQGDKTQPTVSYQLSVSILVSDTRLSQYCLEGVSCIGSIQLCTSIKLTKSSKISIR